MHLHHERHDTTAIRTWMVAGLSGLALSAVAFGLPVAARQASAPPCARSARRRSGTDTDTVRTAAWRPGYPTRPGWSRRGSGHARSRAHRGSVGLHRHRVQSRQSLANSRRGSTAAAGGDSGRNGEHPASVGCSRAVWRQGSSRSGSLAAPMGPSRRRPGPCAMATSRRRAAICRPGKLRRRAVASRVRDSCRCHRHESDRGNGGVTFMGQYRSRFSILTRTARMPMA